MGKILYLLKIYSSETIDRIMLILGIKLHQRQASEVYEFMNFYPLLTFQLGEFWKILEIDSSQSVSGVIL